MVNKMDLTDSQEHLARFKKLTKLTHVIPISAVTGKGLETLTKRIWDLLHPQEE